MNRSHRLLEKCTPSSQKDQSRDKVEEGFLAHQQGSMTRGSGSRTTSSSAAPTVLTGIETGAGPLWTMVYDELSCPAQVSLSSQALSSVTYTERNIFKMSLWFYTLKLSIAQVLPLRQHFFPFLPSFLPFFYSFIHFIENRFFSHTLHPNLRFPSLLYSQSPLLPLPPRPTLPVSLQKGVGLQDTTTMYSKMRSNKTRQKPSC